MPRRISLYEYEESQEISTKGYQFYALLGALMRDADTDNTAKLRAAWPEFWESMLHRYNAPLGVVEEWDNMTPEKYHHSKMKAQEDW